MPVVEPTVALDLNDPDFQSQLFALEKEVQRAADNCQRTWV